MQSIEETLKERGARYGRFMDHAVCTQELKRTICEHLGTAGQNYFECLRHDQREALEMICHKIGRIVCGDPDYADSWHDIAGYAQLVADRLNGIER
jgi:hypothetical protein